MAILDHPIFKFQKTTMKEGTKGQVVEINVWPDVVEFLENQLQTKFGILKRGRKIELRK